MKVRHKKIRYSTAAMILGLALLSTAKAFVSADTAGLMKAGETNLPIVLSVAGGLVLVVSTSVLFSALASKH